MSIRVLLYGWQRLLPVWLLGVCLVGRAAEAGFNAGAPRPNIVLILADDLGFSDLGCFGSEIATPNLDRLASEGVRWTRFYTTPRCCPSRAALLTGLYPQQAGMGAMMEDRGAPGYRGELNRNRPTMAEQLQSAGYHTLMAGKWHLSHIYFDGKRQLNHETDEPFWDTKETWPRQRGFEEFFGTIHGVNSYYDPFSLTRDNTPVTSVPTNFYYTDAISDAACADIGKYAGGKGKDKEPFFLYVAFTAPHWPLQAPEADIAKYRATYAVGWDVIRTNRYRRQVELGIIDKSTALSPRFERVGSWETVKDKAWEANRMATFAAMVERMDRGVGRILAKLKETAAEKNTLVVFLSDNGACDEVIQPGWYDVPSRTRDGRKVKVGNGDHAVMAGPDDVWQSYGPPWANVSDTPFRLFKHYTHEGGIATPFIARWPKGIPARGAISTQRGHVTDLMPTFLELAGMAYPKTFHGETLPSLAGNSLAPSWQGRERTETTPLFWEHEGNRAVREGKWKLVSRHSGNWELYDMESDRTELHDLAAQHPDVTQRLSALYDAWAERCQVLPVEQLPPGRKVVPGKPEGAIKF